MCGRFSLTITFDDLQEYFRLVGSALTLAARYNIAPSQDIPAVRVEGGKKRLVMLHWGLIPFWAKDPKIGYRMINARSETADRLPAFRAAFRHRRCLVLASGFFEWDKAGGSRQPYYITRKDGAPMAFAGLWEHWEDKAGNNIIDSCTILTTVPNKEVSRLHNRMPVILEPRDLDLWLDPQEARVDELKTLLRPCADASLRLQPVSRYVNKPANEGHRCIEPAEL